MKKNQSAHTVCIVGCGGFIGSHLLERLLADERFTVYGLDIVSEKIDCFLKHPSFSFIKADVHDTDTVKRYVRQCDTVISLAALCNPAQYNTIPLEVIDAGFLQPLELVRLCAETGKRLIHFSTSEVYGKTLQGIADGGLPDSGDPKYYVLSEDNSPLILGPISAQRWSYASAKQLLERVMFAYGAEGKLEYTIVRPFNFIGPRMDFIPGIDGEGIPRVFACFMDALLFNKPMQLVDGGKNRRTFCAIRDAIDAIITIIESPARIKNEILNIGNPDNEVTIAHLADMMRSLYAELCPQKQDIPEIIIVSSADFYGKGYEDCDRRMPDISKARQLLGWKPKTGIKTAVRETMASYIRYYEKECAA